MKEIRIFKAGDYASASELNIIVEEVRRLQNIKGGRGIQVTHSAAGVLLEVVRRFLTVDDKYLLNTKYNQSDAIQRLCDHKLGDIADIIRVRACVGEDPRDEDNQLYRAMLMLDRTYGGGERGLEGGWHSDAGLEGRGLEEGDPSHEVAPLIRSIGQLGDVLLLDAGDLIATTVDGDTWCFMNIRQDAHFYMSEERDGRIYFTTTPPGSESTGLPIMGEMIGDPAKANDALSQLKKESVEWRPQFPFPGIEYSVFDWVCYEPLNGVLYRFPPSIRIPTSSVLAHEFVNNGKPSGYSAHTQLHDLVEGQGMGFRIKYSAENLTEGPLNAYYEYEYKIINDGGDLSTAGMVAGSFTIPIPSGNTEQDVIYADVPIVPYSDLLVAGRGCLIIFEYAVRLFSNVADTLVNRLLCTEWEPRLMVVPEPPLE